LEPIGDATSHSEKALRKRCEIKRSRSCPCLRTHQNDGNFGEALLIHGDIGEFFVGIQRGEDLPLDEFAMGRTLRDHFLPARRERLLMIGARRLAALLPPQLINTRSRC
jgi:hypothetical protein